MKRSSVKPMVCYTLALRPGQDTATATGVNYERRDSMRNVLVVSGDSDRHVVAKELSCEVA